ncbi:helix-turn-helix domain-containing protein [Streptomyces sp. NBC_00233]|uniref:helix-turn-helix domain-containing protein n=1 Tax=Streptomyces sp. NBC_00233 TaxID=2975686 RepID=UPI0022571D82|nr:helix-turn-helix domain-containing protein [Streptomyces sp. NBC_00233]MCX5229684.1 helix-turn-helix domain-containing protein [Streptomyces sp. NBC_00233]
MGLKKNDVPVGEADEEAVRRLHAEGLGRNEIARRTGRGTRTVSVIAARLGLEFTTEQTEKATQHRMAQLAEKRAILADALTDDALRLSAQLWEPAKVFNIGGKDNEYTEQAVPEPPAADKRALMAAATAAAAQSLRLVPPETDTQGLAAVDQWLRGMTGGGEAPAE